MTTDDMAQSGRTKGRTRLFWVPFEQEESEDTSEQDTAAVETTTDPVQTQKEIDNPSPESLVPPGPPPGSLEALLEDQVVLKLRLEIPKKWNVMT
jgi:hypothetical protein